MSEQKVWVEKMPESCGDCPCCGELTCNLTEIENIDFKYINKRESHCPLHSIKDHDRELVEKVIKEVEENFTKYLPLRNRTGAWFYGKLNEILKKISKGV